MLESGADGNTRTAISLRRHSLTEVGVRSEPTPQVHVQQRNRIRIRNHNPNHNHN